MIATALIDWGALGKVVLYSLIGGIGVPAIYAFVVLGASRSSEARREHQTAGAYGYMLLSVVGGLTCLAAIAYGIWLMTQK
ncbi:MAG TPA: hypothetical protein VFB41_11090 [Solirubrobacteraceae bacterium]|nr:hypothetical protein [Solirubrobacteraceae bacterium]